VPGVGRRVDVINVSRIINVLYAHFK